MKPTTTCVTSTMLALAVGICCASDLPGFAIVADQAPKAVIVVPGKAAADTQAAATELQEHIHMATGVQLSIVPEDQELPDGMNRLYVGQVQQLSTLALPPLPANSCRVWITDHEAFLYGDAVGVCYPQTHEQTQMGHLFAVYDFLDRNLGVRWLWPGADGTYVPTSSDLHSGPPCQRTIVPYLFFSRLRVATPAHPEDVGTWLQRHRFCAYKTPNYGHAFIAYWKRFGEEHPDWFALAPNGRRGPIDDRTELVQMCVSNPELHQQIVDDWLRTRTPAKPWINCAENDRRAIDPSCMCDRCRAWDADRVQHTSDDIWAPNATVTGNGQSRHKVSLTDRYARFYLAVQALARTHDPDATIVAYAYSGYSQPPVSVKLNANVIVWIVPPFSYPHAPDAQDEFKQLWEGWSATGARLVLRPNSFWSGYCLPYIFEEQFGNDFKYAADHQLVASDFDSLTGMWSVQGPNLYMLGRLHARPDLSTKEVMDEYCSAFGAAHGAIQAYWAFWEAFTTRTFSEPKPYGGWLSKYADQIYTPEVLAEARKLLEHARSQVAGDPQSLARVAFVAKGLRHTELLISAIREWRVWREDPFNIDHLRALQEATQALYDFREQPDMDSAVNTRIAATYERFDLKPANDLYRFMVRTKAFEQDLNSWQFRWATAADDAAVLDSVATESLWTPIKVGQPWESGETNEAPRIGWYKTEFPAPAGDLNYSHIDLMFGAVDKSATVWLNGKQVLKRVFNASLDPDMWQCPFVISLKKSDCAAINTLVVKVEGQVQGGGIWKPVHVYYSR